MPTHLQVNTLYQRWVDDFRRYAKVFTLHREFSAMAHEAGDQAIVTQRAYYRLFYAYYTERQQTGFVSAHFAIVQPQLSTRFIATKQARIFWEDLALRLDLDHDLDEEDL